MCSSGDFFNSAFYFELVLSLKTFYLTSKTFFFINESYCYSSSEITMQLQTLLLLATTTTSTAAGPTVDETLTTYHYGYELTMIKTTTGNKSKRFHE